MGKILLAVSLQRQFKDTDGKYEKMINYVRCSSLSVYGTIFSQTAKDGNNNFSQYLGMDIALGCDERDIEYGCWANYITGRYAGNIIEFLKKNGIYNDTEIDIVGCNLGNIMAIAFLLWDNGYKFNIISSQVYDLNYKDCIKPLKQIFGDIVK